MTAASPALAPVPFWYLRHGQTDWNKNNLAQGTTDVPLDQTGIEQAEAAAGMLVGQGIASLVCSPLIRARVTADIVAARLGLPVVVAAALHEAVFGVREGTPMLAQWFTDWIAGASTPEGAETFAELRARAVGAVNAILAAELAPVLIIAHGGLFRGLRAAMGLAPDERLPNATPQWCEPGDPWRLSTPR